MAQVPFAELCSALHAVLARAEGGEELSITVDGAPVAVLGPVTDRRRWMPRDEFVEMVLRHQADRRSERS